MRQSNKNRKLSYKERLLIENLNLVSQPAKVVQMAKILKFDNKIESKEFLYSSSIGNGYRNIPGSRTALLERL